jgi:putative SOS response-associated peptidase YedK
MCNLYSMTRNRDAISRVFRVSHNRMPPIDPLKQIFPGWTAPVIRKAEDGEREISLLTWGFVLLQDGRAPKRVTNTRDDQVKTGFWRESFEQRRCLVPASSFCEPHDDRKPATWHSHVCGQARTQPSARSQRGTVGIGTDRQARRGAERKASVDQSLIRGLGTA